MAEAILVAVPHETVNDESVRIISWKMASGSRVEKGQLLCEVETSKALMEIYAPEAGVVEYRAAVGDEVPVGSTICEIIPEAQVGLGSAPIAANAASPVADRGLGPPAIPVDELPPARFTRLALSVASEHGIDPASFAPGTLVRRSDVLRKAGALPPEGRAVPDWPTATNEKAKDVGQARNAPVPGVPVEWVELPRRKILEGRILRLGQATCIPCSVTSTCRAPQLRARVNKLDIPAVGLGALIISEAARLLRKYPVFNALHDRGRIGQYREINIGWAIDGGRGLVVPVIRQADQKSVREIAGAMERQLEAYVENTLAPSDFLGGTFTVSDLSGDGVSFFQPLISQGQSGILGIGSDLAGESGELLYLTLAFDHQLAEGRTAARFLRELSKRLEAHAEVEAAPPQGREASNGVRSCALCQRDGNALRDLRAILIKSELPPGFVCSICLAGH